MLVRTFNDLGKYLRYNQKRRQKYIDTIHNKILSKLKQIHLHEGE